MVKIINSYHPNFSGGIGDFLRGSIYLQSKCKELDYDFDIDFKHHPINKHMYSKCADDYHIASIIDIEKVSMADNVDANWHIKNKETIDNVLKTAQGTVVVSSLFSEVVQTQYNSNLDFVNNIKLSEESKKFIRENIYFSKEVISSKTLEDYSVIHFRLGDRQIIKDFDKHFDTMPSFITKNYNFQKFEIDFEEILNKCYSEIDKNLAKNLVVMSDCNKLKQYIMTHSTSENIKVLHTKSAHTSKQPALICMTNFSSEISKDDMFYTALDVFMLSRSKNNVSYSVYKWGSGFVCWISKAFNVPVELKML